MGDTGVRNIWIIARQLEAVRQRPFQIHLRQRPSDSRQTSPARLSIRKITLFRFKRSLEQDAKTISGDVKQDYLRCAFAHSAMECFSIQVRITAKRNLPSLSIVIINS